MPTLYVPGTCFTPFRYSSATLPFVFITAFPPSFNFKTAQSPAAPTWLKTTRLPLPICISPLPKAYAASPCTPITDPSVRGLLVILQTPVKPLLSPFSTRMALFTVFASFATVTVDFPSTFPCSVSVFTVPPPLSLNDTSPLI